MTLDLKESPFNIFNFLENTVRNMLNYVRGGHKFVMLKGQWLHLIHVKVATCT